MAARKNKIGMRFGKLVVLEWVKQLKDGKALYKCLCDCGMKIIRRGDNLQIGDTTSCGCVRSEKIKNIGFQNRKYSKEDSSWRDLYDHYKAGAKKRNLDFNLTHIEIKELCQQDCYLCGISPSKRLGRIKYGDPIITNGIDRINSQKGYTTDNIRPCCSKCNQMKLAMSLEEFLLQCLRIVSFSRKNKIQKFL